MLLAILQEGSNFSFWKNAVEAGIGGDKLECLRPRGHKTRIPYPEMPLPEFFADLDFYRRN